MLATEQFSVSKLAIAQFSYFKHSDLDTSIVQMLKKIIRYTALVDELQENPRAVRLNSVPTPVGRVERFSGSWPSQRVA